MWISIYYGAVRLGISLSLYYLSYKFKEKNYNRILKLDKEYHSKSTYDCQKKFLTELIYK
jgi:hypothetical protein